MTSLRRRPVNFILFPDSNRDNILFKLGEWKIAYPDFSKAPGSDTLQNKVEQSVLDDRPVRWVHLLYSFSLLHGKLVKTQHLQHPFLISQFLWSGIWAQHRCTLCLGSCPDASSVRGCGFIWVLTRESLISTLLQVLGRTHLLGIGMVRWAVRSWMWPSQTTAASLHPVRESLSLQPAKIESYIM